MDVSEVSREKPTFPNDICETCLRDNDLIDITNELHKEIPFVILLERYISPEFYPTPKRMCKPCMHEFMKFNEFIENCKRSILLHETLKNESEKNQIGIYQEKIDENSIYELESNLEEFLMEKNLTKINSKEINLNNFDTQNIEQEIYEDKNTIVENIESDDSNIIKQEIVGEINEIRTNADKAEVKTNNWDNPEDNLFPNESVVQNDFQQASRKLIEKSENVNKDVIIQSNILNQGNKTYRKYSSSNEIFEKSLSSGSKKISLKPLEHGMNTKHKPWNRFNKSRKLSPSSVKNKSGINQETYRADTERSKGKKYKIFKQPTTSNTSVYDLDVDTFEIIKVDKSKKGINLHKRLKDNKVKTQKQATNHDLNENNFEFIKEDVTQPFEFIEGDGTKVDSNVSDVVEEENKHKLRKKYKLNKCKINSSRNKYGIKSQSEQDNTKHTFYESSQQSLMLGKESSKLAEISSKVDATIQNQRNIAEASKNDNMNIPLSERSQINRKSPNVSSSKKTDKNINSFNLSPFKRQNNMNLSNLSPFKERHNNQNLSSSTERHDNMNSSNLSLSKERHNNMQPSNASPFKDRRNNMNSSNLSLPKESHTNTKSSNLSSCKQRHNNMNSSNLPLSKGSHSNIKSSKSKESNLSSSRKINTKSTKTSTYEVKTHNSIQVSTEVTETKSEFTISESTKKTQDWLIQSVHSEDFQRTSSCSLSNEEERKRVASTSTYRSEDADDFDGMSVTRSEINFENCRTGYEYKCDYCPCSFMLVSSLAHHKKVHGLTTISKPYLCEYCGETFMNFSKFRTHRKDHTIEIPYICLYCEKIVRGPQVYNNHIRYHTVEMGELSSTDKFDVIDKLIFRGKFACGFCGKLFGNKKLLQTHLFWHPDEAKLFRCNYCDKTFTQKRSLKNHELLHKEEKGFDSAKGKPNTC